MFFLYILKYVLRDKNILIKIKLSEIRKCILSSVLYFSGKIMLNHDRLFIIILLKNKNV